MKTNLVDIFIYIQSKSLPDVISNMANHISHIAGVARVNPHPNIKKLIAIQYDPNRITGNEILNTVDRNGCSGFLVGM